MRTAAFVVLASIYAASDLLACACNPKLSIAESLSTADAVFVGQVEKLVLQRRWAKHDYRSTGLGPAWVFKELGLKEGRSVLVVFAVERAWKGAAKQTIEVETDLMQAACGYEFRLGERYLVYANKSGSGRLGTGYCSRTVPLIGAAADVIELGTPSYDFFTDRVREIHERLKFEEIVEDNPR